MTQRRATRKRVSYSVVELIRKKREAHALSQEELRWLIDAFMAGEVTDYQLSAFAMAVFFQGMSFEETAALTLAMRDSGTVVDLSCVPGIKVDKHSTGGVGDKVSIGLAPLVAACGVTVPMVSGRGLGHTGGTLDKLEAIPGFSVNLSVQKFVKQLQKIGCSLIGQTAELAPADKRIYALRDVTGTVESIPLITASILSKKLAEGIDALVMDVKVGRGAFMKTLPEARELAHTLVKVSHRAGTRVSAFITAMDSPLGKTIGNALETKEALEMLHGFASEDLVENTLTLGAEMLRLAKVEPSTNQAHKRLLEAIRSKAAVKKMRQIILAQGGDPRVAEEPDRLPKAKRVTRLLAKNTGYLKDLDALELGLCAVRLGAGRTRVDQKIDPTVGMVLQRKPGDFVKKGEPLLEIHHNQPLESPLQERIQKAFPISSSAPRRTPFVLETIRS